MPESIKFDPKKLAKLNNPERLKYINPDLIWETMELQNPEILVDIGAGTGFFASVFSKKISNGKIYACDSSEIMITWMQENLKDSKIIPVLSSENKIPLHDGIADFVYMINLHHELVEPDKILEEAYRLLKNKGKIAVIDWKKEETPMGPPLEIRAVESEVVKALEFCGFKNIKSEAGLKYNFFIIAQK